MDRQNHRIIVEGMDGSGKTTLVEHLMHQFTGVEMVVNTLGPDQDFNDWWPKEFDRQSSQPIPIHDRFFYSELVYGPVLRGHITASDQLIANGTWFLRSHALLIYARPHSDAIAEGFVKNPQMEGVHDKFKELLTAYDQLMAAEKSWYQDRFIQYVWHRDGELIRVTELVRDYVSGKFDSKENLRAFAD